MTEKYIEALEARTESFIGVEKPIAEVGEALQEASRLFMRQQPISDRGALVAMSEVLPPFAEDLKRRLEDIIETLESAFGGDNDDEEYLMQNDMVRIPRSEKQ